MIIMDTAVHMKMNSTWLLHPIRIESSTLSEC